MSLSQHMGIISSLTELYTVLSTSGAIASDLLLFPDPATGLHPAGKIASHAALAAGFSQEVVDLLSALPYLNVAKYEMHLELLPSTFPITYYGNELNEDYFKGWREVLHDEVIPPHILKLTRNELYGFEFIYDVKTKLVTPWNIMAETNKTHYFEVPAKPPQEVFGEIIENFRSLNYLGTPEYVDFNTEYYSNSGGKPPEDYRENEAKKFLAGYDVWAATRRIKDIYLDCGWDVKAQEQTNFQKDEFIRRRDEYWENVVMPLLERERKL